MTSLARLAAAGWGLVIGSSSPYHGAAQLGVQQSARSEQMYEHYLDLSRFIKGGSVTPHWMADGYGFWYSERSGDSIAAYRVDPRTNTKAPFFDSARLRASLRSVLGHEAPHRGVPFESFTLVDNERAARFAIEGKTYQVDLASYAVTGIPTAAELEKARAAPRLVRTGFPETAADLYELPSPDGRWLLGERGHNLWLRSTSDGREEPLTTDGIKDQEWLLAGGRLSNVSGAARWSPNGLQVVAIWADNRQVPWIPILHWLKPTEEVEWRHYTKMGGALPESDLFVIDILSKRRVRIETGGDRDQYFHVIRWLPDGSEILFLRMNRRFNRLDLMAANPETGATRTILTETQPTFIKGIATNPSWRDLATVLPNSKRLLWTSERDGWDHLYLYGLDGKLIRRLTTGQWPVLEVIAVDEAGGWVYFTGHAERRVYDTHLYRVGLDGSDFQRLTEAEGQHEITFAPGNGFFLDRHSSLERRPAVDVRAADGRFLQTIAKADLSALQAIGYRPPEAFVVKAADDTTTLHGVIYKPFDFDPARKYPVIDFLYSGPQTTIVPRTFEGDAMATRYSATALPHLGFIVISVDPRGTPERGKAFQDWIHLNWGRHVIPDHVATLKQLAATRPYLDLERVGVFGGSWGGYSTVRAMVQAPEVFDAGVATYPVVDLYDHWAQAGEAYSGLPQDHPEVFEYASSLRLADRIKGRLLLIHGTSDLNATFSASMKMVEALTRAGKPYDLIVVPEANHGFANTVWRQYWHQAIRSHFEQYLLGSGPAPR